MLFIPIKRILPLFNLDCGIQRFFTIARLVLLESPTLTILNRMPRYKRNYKYLSAFLNFDKLSLTTNNKHKN